jgi:GTP-binding protein
LKVLAADFVTSAAAGGTSTGIPQDGLPQVAMAGRSNVGKSTLINALLRRKVARTSAAPGKTRLANIFRISVEGGPGGAGRWGLYLVDLPGYGYARGGADAAAELAGVAEAYFRNPGERPRPERGTGGEPAAVGLPSERERGWGPASTDKSRRAPITLLLVDSRHPGLEADIQAVRWLATLGVEPLIVATKIDKLSRAERTRNLRELERVFGKPALPVSAERGEGLDELWTTIAKLARGAERKTRARDAETRPMEDEA